MTAATTYTNVASTYYMRDFMRDLARDLRKDTSHYVFSDVEDLLDRGISTPICCPSVHAKCTSHVINSFCVSHMSLGTLMDLILVAAYHYSAESLNFNHKDLSANTALVLIQRKGEKKRQD